MTKFAWGIARPIWSDTSAAASAASPAAFISSWFGWIGVWGHFGARMAEHDCFCTDVVDFAALTDISSN
ncbi:hypothetical protein AM571_PC02103 (plasmid) [Rhizobium etli 8C-3]|uniref:Uncharacterized protein n=1 Tax=Rhizobium etli 8C-3 TaxID=538025 RepID=A0A1L5PHX5_RHIET|nr:hypothetical protein AM571_PC02103 [Rhizobium etli 8C-3]